MTDASRHFTGFTPDVLAALAVPGPAERWAAVQALLHPQLAALAELLRAEGERRFPRIWPIYEITFKNLRYVNRGGGARAPIDEYHFAVDRPPRGSGIYVAVSAAERLVLVTLQVARARKPQLGQVWEDGRAVWQPLIERVTDVRFLEERARAGQPSSADAPWIERYLRSRRPGPLLAGFAYRWDDARIADPSFAQQLIADVLDLLALNEAVMEHAEDLEPDGPALLREGRAIYRQGALPPIETIVERIRAHGFALPEPTIRAYHVALQTKPLVILPGISGTGKTRLTKLYADAVHAAALRPGQENPYYLLVAVQPDWHNARDLLGYHNALTGTFHATPFLRFLQRAAADPAATYYVCLDEMNLARPEYYLAPILSALETEDHLIDLGIPGDEATTTAGEALRSPFRLPLNLRLTGTVNVDESTHSLSDKLLDRANVIELRDVDLAAFRATYRGPVDEPSWDVIAQLHAILTRAGQPFGYRTISEMLRYLEHAQGVIAPAQALDQQIKQKILPKLKGDDNPRLRRALASLIDLLIGGEPQPWAKAASIEPETIAAARFPDSAEKTRRMLERLDADGFTDFYSS